MSALFPLREVTRNLSAAPETVLREATRKLSAPAERLKAIEKDRVFHRVFQRDLAAAALTTRQHYWRLLANPEGASPALITRLEHAMRALAAARVGEAKLRTAQGLPLLPALVRGFFVQACLHYGLDAREAQQNLEGEERPNSPLWRQASHARQAALYLANQALGVPQRELAALIGKSPAAVCQALRCVEDRRDDPDFDRFIDRAQQALLGAFS